MCTQLAAQLKYYLLLQYINLFITHAGTFTVRQTLSAEFLSILCYLLMVASVDHVTVLGLRPEIDVFHKNRIKPPARLLPLAADLIYNHVLILQIDPDITFMVLVVVPGVGGGVEGLG